MRYCLAPPIKGSSIDLNTGGVVCGFHSRTTSSLSGLVVADGCTLRNVMRHQYCKRQHKLDSREDTVGVCSVPPALGGRGTTTIVLELTETRSVCVCGGNVVTHTLATLQHTHLLPSPLQPCLCTVADRGASWRIVLNAANIHTYINIYMYVCIC